ncbi:ras-like protein family member 11B [Hydractinia symbiolongicarpus]|uniref:ras-like protein family member 11B n=1 Tax=Hydractinia symbiolongicarpus TaxID=13093 RepID=UPI00254E732E|nr:ras-like protein family member 11B [Hydractinia symbiolongicarpus]
MVNETNEERMARVVVLGSQGVGKTALVVRCLTRRFLPEYAPCKEASYKYKKSKDGKEFEMMIVDSDGQNNDIYRYTEAFVLVYSVTCKKSLDRIESMAANVRNLSTKNEPLIIIVANQIDLVQKREVTSHQGRTLASRVGAEYREVSVANDVDQVVDMFHYLCLRINGEQKKRKAQKLIDMFKRRGSS